MQKSQALAELVEVMARHLVDKPDEVEVHRSGGERQPRIELEVAEDDIGKVIGKDGRTAKSMRTVLSAAASKLGTGRAYLDIVD